MDEYEFDVDDLVEWFFSCYKGYGTECMPNRVGKVAYRADEMTFNLLDIITKGVIVDVREI